MVRITRCKTYAKNAEGNIKCISNFDGKKRRFARKSAPKFEDLFCGNFEIDESSSILSGYGNEASIGLSLVHSFKKDMFDNLVNAFRSDKLGNSYDASMPNSSSNADFSSLMESWDQGMASGIVSPDLFSSLVKNNNSKSRKRKCQNGGKRKAKKLSLNKPNELRSANNHQFKNFLESPRNNVPYSAKLRPLKIDLKNKAIKESLFITSKKSNSSSFANSFNLKPLKISLEKIDRKLTSNLESNYLKSERTIFASTPGVKKMVTKPPLNLSPVPCAVFDSDGDEQKIFDEVDSGSICEDDLMNALHSESPISTSFSSKELFAVSRDLDICTNKYIRRRNFLNNMESKYISILNGGLTSNHGELQNGSILLNSSLKGNKESQFKNVATRRKGAQLFTVQKDRKLSRLVNSMDLFSSCSFTGFDCMNKSTLVSEAYNNHSNFHQSLFERSSNNIISNKNLEANSNLDSSLNITPGKAWKRNHQGFVKSRVESFLNISQHLDVYVPEYRHSPRLSMVKPICSIKGKEFVLKMCDQSDYINLDECLPSSILVYSKKIGEGVYGEVFMVQPYGDDDLKNRRVLKIMPIEGDFRVNGEPQKTWEEIIPEILVSVELSNLESQGCCGFVKVHRSWCLEGAYSIKLLELWDDFDASKGSENDRPCMFPSSQLYICLEFEHGGQDLESFIFNNATQAEAILWQIIYSLAVGEELLKFEHRDLHWGNVLVSTCKETDMQFICNGKKCHLKTKGVKSTIIDFTLSRLESSEGVVFNDLAKDPSLFESEGDYQFDIYRNMKETNGNSWEEFNPYTNVLWLHYIATKMFSDCYYKNEKTKAHKTGLSCIKNIMDSLLNFKSCLEIVMDKECIS